jgi:hypothetical protein
MTGFDPLRSLGRTCQHRLMRRVGIAVAASLLALGIVSTTTVAEEAPRFRKLEPAELADCQHKGGQVRIAGLSGNEMCALPFADAGKVCRGSDDCLGACLVDEKQWSGKRIGPKTAVVGKCQPTNYSYGCSTTVERGRVQSSMCVD